MTNEISAPDAHVYSLLDDGHTREDVVNQLVTRGHDEASAREIVQHASKRLQEVHRSPALKLVLSGGFICFLSFLLTITSSFSHSSFPYVLYGLTSVGIVVAFTGLMKVF